MRQSGEDRLLAWLRRHLGDEGLLGDDAAVLLHPPAPLLVTMDSQLAEVHFPSDLDPALLARRLLAVNLSDLAAMGAQPTHAFLALATPPGFDHRRFFRSFLSACRHWKLTLAGGDLARAPAGTLATLTLFGTPPPRGRILRRGGARPDHEVWVGGSLGESAAGARLVQSGARLEGRKVSLPEELTEKLTEKLKEDRRLASAARRAVVRHLAPEPQLELGWHLGRQTEGAAMDLSDGLAIDLRRLCRESDVGAEIESESIPLAADFDSLCRVLGVDPLELALGGGEDYVLLYTLPPSSSPPPGLRCRKIGRITRSRRLKLKTDGKNRPLPRLGWDHLSRS